jgi:DNA (cytosine-5)-methyltransferase 1
MEQGGRCVLAIDNGSYPYRRGYFMNYGILPHPKPEILTGEYPKVDILFASVNLRDLPYEKGKKQKIDDFHDTDWYLLLDIINKTKPKAVIIESCKTQKDEILQKSTSTAYRTLKETTGYYVTSPAYLDAVDYGVPQLRKRVWFVAFENPISAINFKWPKPIKLELKLKDILETENVDASCYLSKEHISFIERSNDINEKRGYWYIYNPLDKESYSKSILFGGQGWDRNIIEDIENRPDILPNGKECNDRGIRRLTAKEIYRLQGFPDNFLRIGGWRTVWIYMARATNVEVTKHILKEIMRAIDTKEINKSVKTLIDMGLNFNG